MYNALQSLQAFEMGKGAREERERADAMKDIGNALAGGDWSKAASGAFGMGDISTGLQLQQYGKGLEDAEAESRRVNMIRYGMGLLQSPLEQREAMRGQIAQTLGSMGLQIDPQQAAQMDLSDNGIKSTLMALQDTDGLMKMFQSQMEPVEYQSVTGADGRPMTFDPRAGVYGDPAGPEKPPPPPKYATATTDNGVIAYNTADPTQTRNLGPTPVKTPLVTNTYNAPSDKGESEFQKGLGKNAATGYQAILDEGRAAGGAIGNLDTMETLLDGIDYTGLGGDALLRIQRLGAMFGADIPDLAPKEALKRLSSQMALSLKQDLPGPMSNADREFLLSIPPNLNVSPTGNDAILFILRKREERKQDMMRSLIEANPQSMEEYRMWENNYLQSAPPMFNAATQASLLAALSGASGEDIPQ